MCICRQICAPLASINWKMEFTVYRSNWIPSRSGSADQYLRLQDSEITRFYKHTTENDTGGSFPGRKAAEAWIWPLTLSSAEVNKGGAVSHLPDTSLWCDVKLSTGTILHFSFTRKYDRPIAFWFACRLLFDEVGHMIFMLSYLTPKAAGPSYIFTEKPKNFWPINKDLKG
jgi:hypothetical protein